MPTLALDVRDISKAYRIGNFETFPTRLRRMFHRAVDPSIYTNWALDSVSFSVAPGESVAVVGHNGAGKSTLLKILSRVTEPTRGYADVWGRVGSLLEVGTGFHGELTGRENVFLNGTILGLSRSEVRRRFDEIVDFSGVSRYIDTPVKRYSSGMTVRLAFAVAAFLEPEILIVDEVLAVGDAEFQRRSLGRMSEVTRDGRTVLFVSHNMQAVRRLCDRAILLDHGKLVDDDAADAVVRRYLSSVDDTTSGRIRWLDPETRLGNDVAHLVEVALFRTTGEATTTFMSSESIRLELELDVARLDSSFQVAFDIASVDGTVLSRTAHTDLSETRRPQVVLGHNRLACTIPAGLLNAGRFTINLRISLVNNQAIINPDNVISFDIVADHGESLFLNTPNRPGLIAPILDWDAIPAEYRR